MKFQEINRQRYLSKTPLLTWIKVIAYSSAALSGAYSVYFYFYKAEEVLEKFNKLTKDSETDRKIKSEEKLNRPLQRTAYKNYLKEKKLYQAQLNEETKQRLEKIKNASLEIPSAVTPTTTTPVEPSEQIKTETAKASKTNRLLGYLTFGYWTRKD